MALPMKSMATSSGRSRWCPILAPTGAGDDGYLTLQEICQLDLRACQLAILSACQTNYGATQRGEGVWALTRGFLVAGSRRVVASNWLVDDEAAATLVSFFLGGTVKPQADGSAPDYAAALHAAKRYVRKQGQMARPVLLGNVRANRPTVRCVLQLISQGARRCLSETT